MFYRVCRFFLRVLFRTFWGLTARGLEHIPAEGPVILAPNHVSLIDPLIVGICLDREVHFLAKEELFRNRGLAWLIRNLNAFPVRRERMEPSSLKRALRILREGRVLLIFPEGTRGGGGGLGAAKPGLAAIAARSGATVVPVYHQGTDRAFPRGTWRIRPGGIRVAYGLPLEPPAPGGDLEGYTREIMERIAALRDGPAAIGSVAGSAPRVAPVRAAE